MLDITDLILVGFFSGLGGSIANFVMYELFIKKYLPMLMRKKIE